MKQHIKTIAPHVELYRCTRTGIARIEDGTSGTALSIHPNIAASGSVAGMKRKGYWAAGDQTATTNGFTYNTSVRLIDPNDPHSQIVADHCECSGCASQ